MTFNLRVFLILLLIIGIILVFRTIKHKNLSMKFGLYWTIVFIIMLILIIFPSIIESLALLLGFKTAPNMLFLIAIFILFYIVFTIYANISKLNENNKVIIQEYSILKYELENKKKNK